MKKTNEEILEFFGLKVGDEIKIEGFTKLLLYVNENGKIFAKSENCSFGWDYYDIGTLTNVLLKYEYEVITPKKKLGELICDEMVCRKCPLRAIDCDAKGKTLYEALERYREYLSGNYGSLKVFEKTFIASIKAELDKEI